MKVKLTSTLIGCFFLLNTLSCGDLKKKHSIKIAWDFQNAPEKIGLNKNDYEVNFHKLKKRAQLSQKPWSGGYWPSYQGGITYRWNHPQYDDTTRVYYDTKRVEDLDINEIKFLSPSEKFDLLNGDDEYSLTRKERGRTRVLERQNGHDIPKWFGLCHAWAPATILYDNPGPITVKRADGLEIPFGSSDIKALLVYFLHEQSSKTYFVSRRCDIDDGKLRKKVESGEISYEDYKATMESANCIGVNPGAFHIILTNMIGQKNEGFIADVTRDIEVWNQAVHGYSSRITEMRTDNFSDKADPRTVKELQVETSMQYTIEVSPTWETSISKYSTRTVKYKYWLELNQNDEIIGGTWISNDRPDFLWNRSKPKFTDKYRIFKQLYTKSTKQASEASEVSEEDKDHSEHENREERQPEDISTHKISIKTWDKTTSIFGTRLELSGSITKNISSLKIKYFDVNEAEIKEREVKIKEDLSFSAVTFIWKFQKANKAKLLAFDQNNQLTDTILLSI